MEDLENEKMSKMSNVKCQRSKMSEIINVKYNISKMSKMLNVQCISMNNIKKRNRKNTYKIMKEKKR